MPDQQLTERFDALRQGTQRLAPPVAPDALRRRGHARQVRQRAATAVGAGALVLGLVAGTAGVLTDDPRPAPVLPAGESTTGPAPSLFPAPAPSSPEPDPAPEDTGTTAPSPSTRPEPTSTGGVGDLADYDVPGNRQDFGYLTGSVTEGDATYLLFDRATLLTKDEARAAAEAAGKPFEDADMVHVQNDNPRIRTVPLAEDAAVLGSQQLLGDASVGPAPVAVEALLSWLSANERPLLVELRYDADGLVSEVSEVYTP